MKTLLTLMLLSLSAVSAQAQPRAAMLQTSSSGPAAADVGRAFDRLARSRLESLAPMQMDAAPPLSLEDLQLAVGCVGESAECLRAVAERVGVEVMVVPSVEMAADVYVGAFLRLDVGDEHIRRVARRASTESELLDEVEPMLRELFDLPEREEQAGAVASNRDRASSREHQPDPSAATTGSSADFPVGPAIVAGVGIAAIVSGVVFGVLSTNAQDAYAATSTDTTADVDRARAHLDDAHRNAVIADVLFGVAAGAIIGAAVWWLVGADSPFGVTAGGDGIAVTFEGRWGGES